MNIGAAKEQDGAAKEQDGTDEPVKGLSPRTKPNPVRPETATLRGRAGDYGDMGQFAPGGYYNQRSVTAPRRIDLDEYTAMRTSDEAENDDANRPVEDVKKRS